MRIEPPGYQNNPDWAINNRSKGLYSGYIAVGSTIAGCLKACSSKDSKTYKVCNFFEKLFYSFGNCLQYYLFARDDDVLGDDEKNNPIAVSSTPNLRH